MFKKRGDAGSVSPLFFLKYPLSGISQQVLFIYFRAIVGCKV